MVGNMTNYIEDSIDDLFDFASQIETVDLEPEHQQEALQLSHNFGNKSRQWQVYIQAIALLGFTEWLKKREPLISIHQEQSSFQQPQYTNVIDTICNLVVGDFKVCLIPTISFTDEEISIPRAIIDLPEFTAHFYVIVAIEEELEIVSIRGFIRYDQLTKYKSQLQPQIDWTYQLPLTYFELEPNELLLYLQCLSVDTIPLPEIDSQKNLLSRNRTQILELLPRLHNRYLWQILTWEQGTAILTSLDLLTWIYNYQTQPEQSIIQSHLSDLLQILTQQAVNIRTWFNNRVDEIIQVDSWTILPPASLLMSSMRGRNESNPVQELEDIIAVLQHNYQIEIPANASRGYQDVLLEHQLRLYAITWSLPDDEWTLLFILKAIFTNNQSYVLSLRVSDQTGVLVQEHLQPNTHNDYIFTQVIGSYEDKFLVTIISENDVIHTFSPFEFIVS